MSDKEFQDLREFEQECLRAEIESGDRAMRLEEAMPPGWHASTDHPHNKVDTSTVSVNRKIRRRKQPKDPSQNPEIR